MDGLKMRIRYTELLVLILSLMVTMARFKKGLDFGLVGSRVTGSIKSVRKALVLILILVLILVLVLVLGLGLALVLV